jgi:hypothetical protein
MHKNSPTIDVICDWFVTSKPVYKKLWHPETHPVEPVGAAAPSLGTTELDTWPATRDQTDISSAEV